MAVTQKVTLYNNKFTVPPVINAVQNDTDRQIEAYFGDFTLQVGMTGKLSFIRSDGTHYEASATLNTGANTATAELDQALTQAGVTQAQLKITDSGNVGSTFTFMIKVQPDVAGISVPQDGWSAQEFDQRLTDAENAIDAVEKDVADLQDKEYDYAPVITDTASGAVASFEDGADSYPLKECVVDVDAVQDLHGYDNPWPAGGGKNLLDLSKVTIHSGAYGLSFSLTDNIFRVYGTAATTTTGAFTVFSYADTSLSGRNLVIQCHDVTGGTINNIYGLRTSTEKAVAIAISMTEGETVDIKFKVTVAETSQSEWTPYSNICPISGWSGVKVSRTGKNLFDKSEAVVGKYINQSLQEIVSSPKSHSGLIPVKPSTSYFMNGFADSSFFAILAIDEDKQPITWYGGASKTAPFAATMPSNCRYVYLNFNTDQLDTMAFYEGSVDEGYIPYQGESITIDLGSTRYGGTLDVTRGKLNVTHAIVDLGSLSYTKNVNNVFLSTGLASVVRKNTSTTEIATWLTCEVCKPETPAHVNNGGKTYDNCISVNSNGTLIINMTTYSSVTPENFPAQVSGYDLVYELATPIEVDLTPTEITTLLGMNCIFASTGDVSVTYGCDTRKFLEKIIASL